MKRVADEDLFQPARLERYWVVDEGRRVGQERQAQRATIEDAGEESDGSEP